MITEITVITTDGVIHHIGKVESYSYDRDFVRVHSITDVTVQVVNIFPTDKVASIEYKKWG